MSVDAFHTCYIVLVYDRQPNQDEPNHVEDSQK